MAMQERAVRTRTSLIHAAAAVFAEEGYVPSSLTTISKRAGVSNGALHFHFESKKALARAVEDEAAAAVRRLVELTGATGPSAVQALVDATHGLADHLLGDTVVRAGFGLGSERSLGRQAPLLRTWHEWVGQTLRRAEAEGRLAPGVSPDEAAAVVVAVTVGFETLAGYDPRWLARQRIAGFWNLLLPGLAAEHVLAAVRTRTHEAGHTGPAKGERRTAAPPSGGSTTGARSAGEEHRVDERQLLRSMVRIRCVGEVIADAHRDQRRTRIPVHFSIGQEAAAVGVCAALRPEDVVYSGHRCHAHYLAKGGDLSALVAELYGRETGCAAGRGGSVHLVDESAGFGASSAVLGEMTAVATGAAWAFARQGAPRVAVGFFGDGASEEGVLHESLSFAALHQLPVLYVCENDQYALSSPRAARRPPGTGISGRARGYGIPAARLDGDDVAAVHAAAVTAAGHCRDGGGPYLLELDTYRRREHAGPHGDHIPGGRPRAEVGSWTRRCPVRRAADALRGTDPGTDERIAAWEREFRAEAHAAIAAAEAVPHPRVENLLVGTYGDRGTYAG